MNDTDGKSQAAQMSLTICLSSIHATSGVKRKRDSKM